MTHNEERSDWILEGFFGLATGILYGATSVLVGHPFDTIKTKMQAEIKFKDLSMLESFSNTWRTRGIRGIYAGSFGPLWGSSLYRSSQFAVFEALYTKFEAESILQSTIPLTNGLKYSVIISGLSASTTRSLIECPIEFAKVSRQTGQSWKLAKIYQGFLFQWIRTSGVMITYFSLIDSIRRHRPETFSSLPGQFLASSSSATLGFWLMWPAETIKNQIQANTPIPGNKTPSAVDRLMYILKSQGIRGLYKGIFPGTLRAFFSNGASMVVMVNAQKFATDLGFRQ